MEVVGSIYTEVSDDFQRGVYPIARCVKAENHDLGVVLMEQRRLGNLYGDDRGTGFAGNVWDKNYISPSLTTMQGGMREPMIVDKQIVAMRGRNPDNPSDRTTGIPIEQRLEVNMQGTSNCLTSVQKDNLVMESQVLTPKRTEYGKQIRKAYESGQIQESRHNMTELEPRKDGVSNTLTTVQKDNMVLESVLAVDEQNMNVRKETFGTLTTDGSSPKHNNRVMIRQATKDGSIECEIGGCFDASYPNSKTRRGRVQDKGNTCPTLTAQNQEVVRIEKVGQISSNGSQCGTVVSDNGISANLVAGTHGYANSHIATQYRIRKLTPRECGRLMGVSDEDIDKMAAVNSNTQLYKQFGNSIVVDVMCAMFKNLNINQ